MKFHRLYAVPVLLLFTSTASLAAGDATRGAQVFGACAACHSLSAGDHRSGPSLAKVYGRHAGTVDGFQRYSPALRKSGVVWNDKTLDDWLRDPQAMVPGNFMTFRGLQDGRARADLLSYLKVASEDKNLSHAQPRSNPNLKHAPLKSQVKSIRHCRDTYFVTDEAGESVPFWEYNLRFKTDTSAGGPSAGHPVLVGQGMQGDRAQVVFASPGEISSFIRQACQ